MYKIGELSRLCRIPVKTLRYYDSEGLLVPDEIDRFRGYRYYSAARLADCNRIISLKELGFSLEEIKKHLHANTDEDIVGKWEIRDIVPSKEQFVYGHPKCPDVENSIWSELYFPEGGEPYWFLKGWTKGFLYLEATIPEPHIVANPYSIEYLNGHTIMFVEKSVIKDFKWVE